MAHKRKVSVVGLGYVGLPVAMAFGNYGRTIGFDLNTIRLAELRGRYDRTNEIASSQFESAKVSFTDDINELRSADFHIVAVPTPITESNQPNLEPLKAASRTVGAALSKGDIVVYESTVYPGVTEDCCIDILEEVSGLKNGEDFTVGYSPERINPGDKNRTFTKITKVVSAQDDKTLNIVADVYGTVVEAGIYKAASIKAAEAAKVIENTQRDLNIALMNELAVIFDRMNLDTTDVLNAAATKWNFLHFKPGLVGGHCIGVDPYYLTHKAEQLGYIPQVILSGRRINDDMGKFIAQKTVKQMILAGEGILGNRVTVLGLTFKENCPDLRNSKVIDVIRELESYGIQVQVCDPIADKNDAREAYGIELIDYVELEKAGAVVVAVSHAEFTELSEDDFRLMLKEHPTIIDVKGCLSKNIADTQGFHYWRL